MAEKIFEIGLKADDYMATAQKLKKEIDALAEAQREAKRTGDTSSQSYIENEIALKELKGQYKLVTKEIADYNKQQVATSEYSKAVSNELNKEVNTIAEARNQIKALNKIKQNLNVNNKEEAKLLEQVNARIDKNTNFLRENGSAEDKRILNIGNYASALQGVNPKLAMFLQSGQRMVTGLKAQRQALLATNGSLKAFKIALISTGIGAIVIVLGLLITAFMKTQKAIDAVNSVLTPLKIVMESLWGVAERLGEKLVTAFSHPKQLLSDLLDFMEGQVTNRIKAFGDLWDNIWSGDFDKVSDNLLTVATGVEDVTGKIKDMAAETNSMLDEAWKRGKRIADLDIQISNTKITQGYAAAKLTRLLKEQELISKDTTKSAEERAKAVEYAEQLSKQKLALEKHLLDLEKERLAAKQKSSDTDRDGKREYMELLKREEEFKTKAQKDEMKFLGVKNQLAKQAQTEALKRAKEYHQQILNDLNVEIDTYIAKNQKVLESDTELNKKTLDAKVKVLAEINRMELKELDKKLEFGLIKENEYNLAKLELENSFQAQLDDLRNQWYDKQLADQEIRDEAERQKRATDLELELQELEYAEMSKWEKQNEIDRINKEKEVEQLAQDWENKIITDEQMQRKLDLINAKYAKKEQDRQIALANTKMQIKMRELEQGKAMAHQTAVIATALFGKSKEVSAAMTLVDTYVAAQKAYASQLIPGDPSSVLRASLAAAAAVASGLANVKQILSADSKGASTGGGGGASQGYGRPTSSQNPIQSTSTPTTTEPQPSNVISNYNQTQSTVRVINVARDTYDVSANEIAVENFAND